MWELFVPFIASVIVTILLRRLDRSNLKLSKMKKYVSKALEDFDKSVRVKEKQFQDASIDFEIQIRQGRALMQDLNTQAEIIAAKLEALKNDQTVLEKIQDDLESVISSADTVGDQVEAIDASLEKLKSRKRELNQMETQLGRVRKEASEMVGAFSSKVKQTAEDMFQALNEKVGGIEQHYLDKEEELFAQNKIELEKFSNRLRSEMTELQTDLTSSVDLILKDTHEKIDSYGDKIDQMERSVIHTQEKAENEFHNLREEALRYTTDLDGQFMKLSGQISKTTDDLNGIRENLYKELYSESQKVRAEIQEFNLDAIAKKDEIVNAAPPGSRRHPKTN